MTGDRITNLLLLSALLVAAFVWGAVAFRILPPVIVWVATGQVPDA